MGIQVRIRSTGLELEELELELEEDNTMYLTSVCVMEKEIHSN